MRGWFAVAGFVAALCAAHPGSAASPACPPAVVVEGEGAAASSLRDALSSRGILTRQAQPCPALRAKVARKDGQLAIELRADSGRSEHRTLSTPEIAALWIESWTRTDIGSSLLPTRWHPPPRRRAVTTPSTGNTLTRVSQPVPATTLASAPRRVLVGVAAETVTAGDSSSWTAVGIDACIEVGGACVGLSGRYARNLGFTRDDALLATDRVAIDLSATAGIPLRVGRGTLMPEVSVGGRWLSRTGSVETLLPPGPCDPADPNVPDPTNPDGTPGDPACPPEQPGTMQIRQTSRLLHAGARLSYALPVSDTAAITLGVGAAWLPQAHTANYSSGGVGRDGTITDDPNLPPDPNRTMPGDPSWSWSAGIGLRMELQ